MKSIRDLYKIGKGPSSSHTMGPERAAHRFKEKYPQADRFLVTLYGSLAKTGKGHLTDDILVKTFAPLPVEIRFDLSDKPLPHPNTLELTAIENDKEIGFERVMSVGGGKILSEGETEDAPADVYPLSTVCGRVRRHGDLGLFKGSLALHARSRHPRFRDRRHLKRRFRRAAQSENALPSKSHR